MGIVCAEHGVVVPYLPLLIFWGGGVTGQTARAGLAGCGGVSRRRKKAQLEGWAYKAKLVLAGLVDYALCLAAVIVINEVDLASIVQTIQSCFELIQIGALLHGCGHLLA